MKIKKKMAAGLIAVSAAVMVFGCGGKSASMNEEAGVAAESTAETTAAATERMAQESEAEAPLKRDASGTDETENSEYGEYGDSEGAAGPGGSEPHAVMGAAAQSGAEIFAETVQEAVADRDMESLAGLIEFPFVLISTDKESITILDEEEFLKQNPDMIFGDDLMIAIANVDTAALVQENGVVTMGDENSFVRYRENREGGFVITDIQE